eukprot:3489274-Prymnesium_polylepis.1
MLPEQARARKGRKIPPGGKPGKYPGKRTRGHEPVRRGVSTIRHFEAWAAWLRGSGPARVAALAGLRRARQ